jgi:hypothetical protein
MILVLFSELRHWYTARIRITFPVSAAALALVGGMFSLQPVWTSLVVAAGAFMLGWVSGAAKSDSFDSWDSVRKKGITSRDLVVGKLLAVAAIAAAHVLLLVPVLILCVQVWGLPVPYLLLCALLWVLTALVGASFAVAFRTLMRSVDGYFGALAAILLYLPSLFVVPLRLLNPFYRTWRLMKFGDEAFFALGFLPDLVLILALAAFSRRLLRANPRRQSNE